MPFELPKHFPNHNDLRPVVNVLNNALADLELPGQRVSGALCTDIRYLGFSQEVAIDHILPPPRPTGPRAKLAAQACSQCTKRDACNDAVSAYPSA